MRKPACQGARLQTRASINTLRSGLDVLHVVPSVSLCHGGPSRAIVEIERALASRGITVTTVTTDDDGDAARLAVECGLPVAGASATRWYFRRNTVLYKLSIGLARWLHCHIRDYDVVHVHALFSFAPVVAAMMARRNGVPYVVRPLGLLNHYGMTHRRPRLKKVSFELFERRILESAAAVHFVSEQERSESHRLGIHYRSVVIPLGIETSLPRGDDARHPKRDGEPIRFLFLSRIDPKKNLDGLLRAVAMEAKRRTDFGVVIAGGGDPDYVGKLKRLAADLGISGQLEWLGHVDGVRKYDALRASDAFILPSFSENFGVAVVEALSAGLPCLVSREIPFHGEIEASGAGFATGTDSVSIAGGIDRMLEHSDAFEDMSWAARRLASRDFSAEIMGERLEALYREVLMPAQKVAVAEIAKLSGKRELPRSGGAA